MQDTLRLILHEVQKTNEITWVFWLAIAGSIASIIGLAITIWLLIIANKVSRFIHLTKRIPIIINELLEQSSHIGELLEDYAGNSQELHIELGKCVTELTWLMNHSKRSERKTFKALMKRIEKQRKLTSIPLKETREIHAEILVIIHQLKIVLKDGSINVDV